MDHPNPVVRVTTPDVADSFYSEARFRKVTQRVPVDSFRCASCNCTEIPNEWDDKEMVLYATEPEVECTIIVL